MPDTLPGSAAPAPPLLSTLSGGPPAGMARFQIIQPFVERGVHCRR